MIVVERSRAAYEQTLTTTPEGEYKFWLSSPAAPNPKPRAEGKVLAPPGEMERVRMATSEMIRSGLTSDTRSSACRPLTASDTS